MVASGLANEMKLSKFALCWLANNAFGGPSVTIRGPSSQLRIFRDFAEFGLLKLSRWRQGVKKD